ncbi:MAG: glycerophosphodiester phosphodiesterase family protein [Oscillospiraceae bacterium]|jgi:glycerophosphoryl diester phosphodiesterase
MYAAIAVLIIMALLLYLWMPRNAGKDAKKNFAGHSFAHRGLYDNEAGIPENSLKAFHRAMEAGFGCELDVQLTSDEHLVVFHDDNLKRACGVDRLVRETSFEEISKLGLFGTDERIPTFDEVLAEVDGKEPLIVELKSERPDKRLNTRNCEETLKRLRNYKGTFCIESFDPTIVGWFRKNAPDIVRGQLSMRPKRYVGMNRFEGFLLGDLLLNCIGRPDFIAYDISMGVPFCLKLCRKLGAFYASWTCREPSEHEARLADGQAVIFEKYVPEKHAEEAQNA